jgi:glycosyltransferase involved in cell wall biosynthesis
MAPYLEMADIAIAPIFDGAGMKVKVAEALSYQLPVMGTPHAFVGYKIQDGVNSYIAETAESFIKKLTFYQSLSEEERKKVSIAAYSLYKNCYSQTASTKLFHSVIESI